MDKSVNTATLGDLKLLYANERSKNVEKASALSEKVLFPTNLERQNVQYVVRLFNEKNVAAVQELELPNAKSTAAFLERIISWWNIENVKCCFE